MQIPLSIARQWLFTRLSFAEMSIGIMVGCLPSLPRFFKQSTIILNRSSFATQFASNKESGWMYWRRLWHKSGTAHTDIELGQVSRRSIFGSIDSKSKAPYLPTLNFSLSTIHLFDEDIPKRPLFNGTEGMSVQNPQLYQEPAPWPLGDEASATKSRRDTNSTDRTLC